MKVVIGVAIFWGTYMSSVLGFKLGAYMTWSDAFYHGSAVFCMACMFLIITAGVYSIAKDVFDDR